MAVLPARGRKCRICRQLMRMLTGGWFYCPDCDGIKR